MNLDTLGPIIIAVCCLQALATAATTMDAAVDTDPDEVISTELLSPVYSNPTVAEVRETVDERRNEAESAAESDASDQSETIEERAQPLESTHEGENAMDERPDDEFSFLAWFLRSLLTALIAISPYLILLTGAAVILAKRDQLREFWRRSIVFDPVDPGHEPPR